MLNLKLILITTIYTVACTRRTRSEVSDDDEGDDDANSVGAGAAA